MNPSYGDLPGIHPSPNIQTSPDVYEVENRAADPDQHIEQAMQAIASWVGKVVLDLVRVNGNSRDERIWKK